MGMLSRITSALVGKSGATSTSDSPAGWFLDWARGGRETVSGEMVNPDTAMRQAAVYACVKVKSEDIGKVPCILYKRQADGGKARAIDHPLYDLLRNQPNDRHTAFEFKQMMQAHKDLRGNGYALKEEDGRGRTIALWPLPTQFVTALRAADGSMFYRVAIPGLVEEVYPARLIVHLRGLTLDGYTGISPIAYHRETVGMAIGAMKYGASFFGNSAQPNGALKIPTVVSKEAQQVLRESWNQRHQGARNGNRLAIFDGGMEWLQTGMNNTDAQYLETRRFQNSDIYRIFRMPPHKVGDLDKATFSNIEQQSLEYVTDCLLSDIVSWEQTLSRDLLTPQERKDGYFFEFMIDVLLRGDFKSRMDGFAIARNWGLLNADECREMLNLNHIPDGLGQIYLQPLNMVPAGTPPAPAATTPATNDNPGSSPSKATIIGLKAWIAAVEARQTTPPAE